MGGQKFKRSKIEEGENYIITSRHEWTSRVTKTETEFFRGPKKVGEVVCI